MQTLDLLLHMDQVHLPSLITGLIAIVLVVILQRTRLKNLSVLAGDVQFSPTIESERLPIIQNNAKV